MEITGCYSQMTHTKLYTISLSVNIKYDIKLLTMLPVLKSGLSCSCSAVHDYLRGNAALVAIG